MGLNRTGLTPGRPIQITVTGASNVLWVGGFRYGAGPLQIDIKAKLTALVGSEFSGFSEITFGLPRTTVNNDLPSDGAAISNEVAGYMEGSLLPNIQLEVPWETDLTTFRLRFDQDATITGSGASFFASSITTSASIANESAGPLRLSLVSVPEPTATVCLAVGLLLLPRRRRTAGSA